jgi:hypothetical protein
VHGAECQGVCEDARACGAVDEHGVMIATRGRGWFLRLRET